MIDPKDSSTPGQLKASNNQSVNLSEIGNADPRGGSPTTVITISFRGDVVFDYSGKIEPLITDKVWTKLCNLSGLSTERDRKYLNFVLTLYQDHVASASRWAPTHYVKGRAKLFATTLHRLQRLAGELHAHGPFSDQLVLTAGQDADPASVNTKWLTILNGIESHAAALKKAAANLPRLATGRKAERYRLELMRCVHSYLMNRVGRGLSRFQRTTNIGISREFASVLFHVVDRDLTDAKVRETVAEAVRFWCEPEDEASYDPANDPTRYLTMLKTLPWVKFNTDILSFGFVPDAAGGTLTVRGESVILDIDEEKIGNV